MALKQRAQFLRRQIALYRRYLADGVAEILARKYRTEIAMAETEIAVIEKDNNVKPK